MKNGKLKNGTNGTKAEQIPLPVQRGKSVFWAYVCWLFGGIFGLHHFYLGRDHQAFVWLTTLGGYFGIGWVSDAFKIRKYVENANDDPKFLAYFIPMLKIHRKPPFSLNRFISMITVGYFWAQIYMMAIPSDEFWGINWKFLNWGIPLAAALGVWTVGNVGRQKGTIWFCLIASYIGYLSKWYFYDVNNYMMTMVLLSGIAFEYLSKEWRRTPPNPGPFWRRVFILSLCATIYLSLWGCHLYFNCTVVLEDEEIPVHEAITHFLTSPWWTDLKNSFFEVYDFAQHHGWYEVWKQIIALSDPHGEINAYRVLELSQDASQSEITSKWRQLSKEWHPDKVKDPEQRSKAQERFMEIQQAYEILSKVKMKRQKKNKKSDSSS